MLKMRSIVVQWWSDGAVAVPLGTQVTIVYGLLYNPIFLLKVFCKTPLRSSFFYFGHLVSTVIFYGVVSYGTIWVAKAAKSWGVSITSFPASSFF